MRSSKKTIRKTFRWLVVIVFLLSATGGGYGYWFWTRSDEMLRQGILDVLAEKAPGWKFEIGRARFDWRRRIRIYNLTAEAPDQTAPMVTLPEVVVTIDRETFNETQQIVIHKIKLRSPEFEATRDVQGRWNWQKFPKAKKSEVSLPEIEIEQATLRVWLDHPNGAEPTLFVLEDAEARFVPSGKRRYMVKGETQIREAGLLKVDGDWDIDVGSWSLDGSLYDMATSDELLNLIVGASPELREKLGHADAALHQIAGAARIPNTSDGGVPDLGVGGTLDVDFRIASAGPKVAPEIELHVGIRQGWISNPALPFPLNDVEGRVHWDNRQLVVERISGSNGNSRVTVSGRLTRTQGATPCQFNVNIRNLEFNEGLRNRLKASWMRSYDMISPSGFADWDVSFEYDGVSKWRYHNFLMTLKDCAFQHVSFQYPLHAVNGTIQQVAGREKELEVHLVGLAAHRRVTCDGYVKNPGLDAEVVVNFRVNRFPLDAKFAAACSPAARRTLKALNFGGFANAHCRFIRPAGPRKKFQMELAAGIIDGSIQYEYFKYPLTDLTGIVTYKSREGRWSFQELKAKHGPAVIKGHGTFSQRRDGDPGLLTLGITAKQADLDDSLRAALPDSLRKVWDELSPGGGKLDVITGIDWIPGQEASVSLPHIEITRASLLPRAFPYPLSDVWANFSYDATMRRVEILSFSGRHGRATVHLVPREGRLAFDGPSNQTGKSFATWEPNGQWRLRLFGLRATNIDPGPNTAFRHAFSRNADLKSVMDELNLKGLITISGPGMIDFRGTEQNPDLLTAAWDMKIGLTGNSLTAGVDIKNVKGIVTVRGQLFSSGRVLMDKGNRFDLSSADIWGHSLTNIRGPYRFDTDRLFVGAPEVFARLRPDQARPKIPDEKQVIGHFAGGTLTLNANVELANRSEYDVRVKMTNGSLQRYVREQLSSGKNVRGVVDAWFNVHGWGSSAAAMTGKGQVRISHAALYDLPVFLQMFNVMSGARTDTKNFRSTVSKTAFRYAIADVSLARGRFQFRPIDLVGDVISLRGQGVVDLDGNLSLDFYSKLPKQRVVIPLVTPLLRTAATGWVGVRVNGTIENPHAEVTAAPLVDKTLRQFLRAFGPPPPGRVPRLAVPGFTPPASMPRPPPGVSRRPRRY